MSFFRWNIVLLALTVSLVAVLSAVGTARGAEQQEPGTLVRREMVALDSAFKSTMDAVVLNQPARILPAFQETNALRAEIERAIKNRVPITLPRNQKRFKEFVRMDNKFHQDLELLFKAAKKNNIGLVQRQTHRLFDACVRCHRIFR
jgi:cytochrome c556